MIKLDWINDTELIDVTDKLFSICLPHKNFAQESFIDTISNIETYVEEQEFDIPHRILMNVFKKYYNLMIMSERFKPILSRGDLDRILTTSLVQYMDSNRKVVSEYLNNYSDNVNMEIPEQSERYTSFIYSKVMDLYDRCFALEQDPNNLSSLIIPFKETVKVNAVTEIQKFLTQVLITGAWLDGKYYKGTDDYIYLSSTMISDLSFRFVEEDDDENILFLDDISKVKLLREKSYRGSEKLCDYGIPLIDDYTPMLPHRLVVFCAKENTGKTIYSCYLAAKLILNGKRVVYMCGESQKYEVMNKILCSYISQKYDMIVSEAQIRGIEEVSEEHIRLINLASLELTESKCLIMINHLSYDKCNVELAEMYSKYKFQAVIVDHSCSLEDSPNAKYKNDEDRVKDLAVNLRKFKKKFPVCVMVDSHLSSAAQAELEKFINSNSIATNRQGAKSSPTRSSGVLSKEADEIFVLYNTDLLTKQSLIGIQVFKRRIYTAPRYHIYLKVNYPGLLFEYRDEDQITSNDNETKSSVLADVANEIREDEDEDDFDISLLDDEDEDF